jgi:hypothetical protein
VAGQWGGAAGTNYVTLTARLIGDAVCAVHASPAVRITDASGSVIGTASPADPVAASRLVDLGPSLDYNLGWASWCGAPPAGPFHASVALVSSSEPTEVELPPGYGPSGCMGAPSTVSLEPAFEP